MADSTDDPLWTIFGVKLKPSAIAENIAASLVIGLAGFLLLDFFTAFSNQLGRIMPTSGSATANVIDFSKIAIAVIFAGAFAWHLNRLGVSAANDAALTRLRARLTAGETAGTWYARIMRSAIFLTDRFFGDAGKARKSWRPNAFGLKKAAPLWTATSFDQCLLIALVYPLLCIYLLWALTGNAGDVGKSLGLIDGIDFKHIGRVTPILTMIFSLYIIIKFDNFFHKFGMFLFLFSVAGTYLFTFELSFENFTINFFTLLYPIISIISMFNNKIKMIFSGILSIYIILIFSCVMNFGGKDYILIFTFFGSFLSSLRNYFSKNVNNYNVKYLYLLLYFTIFISSLLMPMLGGSFERWLRVGALVYFAILLTIINAPFDWFALGITRGLLRKGLEKGGLWPLGLGVIDLFISLFTVALLGITVLIVTQIFNATTLLGGAAKLVVDPLAALRDLATPSLHNQPQYYWLYLMLLTTQIPAILNLGAGFLSVIRTGDFGNMWVLRLTGDGQGVGLWTRGALAAVQALQFALAMTAGGLLFYLLFIGFVTVEPFAAGNLIDLLLWIAEANWPARLLGVSG